MNKEYLAHISNGRKQTVFEHCRNVSNYAGIEAERVGLGNTLRIAGILHDIGKMTEEFDVYLKKAIANPDSVKRGSVNHSSAGAKYIIDFGNANNIPSAVTEMIAYSIFSHHGVNDCVDENGIDKFSPRLKVNEKNYKNILDNIKTIIDSNELKKLLNESEKELVYLSKVISTISYEMKPHDNANVLFLVGCAERLILSYLVDADRRDTAEFMQNKKIQRKSQLEINELWDKYQSKLSQRLTNFQNITRIDRLRKQMSDYCFDFVKNGNGIYRLSIPTGGGKTLSSMRYALALAEKENKQHIIYVAPFLSILEQNASEIKSILRDDDNILEHHSNVCINENNNEEIHKHELLVDDWSAPIIMTTTVQFLNTLFDGSMQSVRRLHQLTNAVIIIDEAQSIPIKCLNLFTTFMNFLNYFGKSTIVMCTATQPLFEEIKRPLLYNQEHRDMVPNIEMFSNEFKRVNIVRPKSIEQLDYKELALYILEKMDENILVVLNTKNSVREVYKEIRGLVDNSINVIQLTTYMCAQHRLDTIKKMKSMLGKQKIICISTQLIEAGVDISFQTVIRSMAGLDSITQSAGRCNRNGERKQGTVYIVNVKENLSHLKDIRESIQATKRVLDDYQGDLLMPEAIKKYYERYYYPKISDRNSIYPMDYFLDTRHTTKDLFHFLSNNQRPENYHFWQCQAYRYAGKHFSVINNGKTVGVITQYGDASRIVEELMNNPYDLSFIKNCLKKLQRYTVNVYETDQKLKELENRHGITRFNNDILILDQSFYTNEEGLCTDLPLEIF